MQTDRRPGKFLPAVRSIAWWLLASLVAVAALQINALFGLTLAIAGGIVFGILLFTT